MKKLVYGLAGGAVLSVCLVCASPVHAQAPTSQFAPDPSVFDELTSMQREISRLEREVVLQDLKLRRRELDLQMQDLEQKEADKRLEREQSKREEQEAEKQAKLQKEREDALKKAEEDLRISELRASREAILRKIQLATEEEEDAAKKKREEEAAAKAKEQAKGDGVEVVPEAQVQQWIRSTSAPPRDLIVTPGQQSDTSLIEQPSQAASGIATAKDFDSDLTMIADMLGVQAPKPAPQVVEVAPEPEPEPDPVAPVVRLLRGVQGILKATLVLPKGGSVEVEEGDSIPDGWTITSIKPSAVMAKNEKLDKPVRLAFGTSVAMAEEPMMQPAAMPASGPSLSGGFNPIGVASAATAQPQAARQGTSFPVPSGFSGF